ncbi:NAD+ diphosphatase [Rhodobium orientis]|uniref:NAD(+) diphosphatase n=1 Tax=Rhodobium orientis TaxID=34017 RepID=A0A327JPA7_9HYPH|nr:NAD(+) diphosphatase [Rhodobium orientis]MBB4301974.1 NAD+ diphosphatase [Rhodobium orientis]MBK5950211.1 hypothetical protein [Rhodobium orientis]RAI27184.1 hypothetical protein CH339_11350 [Rhodobium orientis]
MKGLVFPDREASLLPGFCGNDLDRVADRREDPAWIDAQTARSDMRIYLFDKGSAVVDRSKDGADAVQFDRTAADTLGLDPESLVFLGLEAYRPRFAGRLLPGSVVAGIVMADGAGSIEVADFRALASSGTLAAGIVGALAEARSLTLWHESHGFCARCGETSAPAPGGWRRDCASCGAHHFPRTDPVVIMMAIDGTRALFGRQPQFPEGMYSALAGYVEPGETIEAAVRREILEEAGITVGRVVYHASQPWPFPSTLMLGCFAEATSTEITIDPEELEDARWFDRAEIAAMLDGAHPDGLKAPHPLAIAHWLARAFVEMG